MNFEETLKELIRKSMKERNEENQKRSDFDSQWEIRRNEILRMLEKAAKVITDELGESNARRNNGGVVLVLRQHELKFSPDRDKMEIICLSSAVDDPGEGYSLGNMTDSVVALRVNEFVRTVIIKNVEAFSRPMYEIDWGV
jgi:hypothetical protein